MSRGPVPELLVADTQPDTFERLLPLLANEGYHVEPAASGAAVLDALDTRDFDTVLLDSKLARDFSLGAGARDLLAEISARDDTLPVVLITPAAVSELVGRVARDFIQKPWDAGRILATVRTQVELARAIRRGRRVEAENDMLRPPVRPMLIADAPAVKPAIDLMARVAASGATILITGERSTGKATVARAIHALSRRSRGPFITLATAGMPDSTIESALFGHARGGLAGASIQGIGRFELADGGTLFIDEVAGLPASVQPALLRAIETGEFERAESSRTRRASVRLISSTTADLRGEVAAGRFRQDLLLRLGTVEIPLPPLRDRREDIPALAHQFLQCHAQRHRKVVTGFEHASIQAMLEHYWPGNIRELDYTVERGVLMAVGTAVGVADLGLLPDRDPAALLADMSLERVEALLIGKALARSEGNVSRAAKALGLSRSALYRRLQRYGL